MDHVFLEPDGYEQKFDLDRVNLFFSFFQFEPYLKDIRYNMYMFEVINMWADWAMLTLQTFLLTAT